MATDADIEYAWVKGWTQAYHDLWDIFAIANADEALAAAEQRATESEARAERLAAAMRNAEDAISRRSSDYALRILDAALTAPATQSDERDD